MTHTLLVDDISRMIDTRTVRYMTAALTTVPDMLRGKSESDMRLSSGESVVKDIRNIY